MQVDEEQLKALAPSKNIWRYVFEETPEGKEIFNYLTNAHYDIRSFDPDPYVTAFNEGRRAVVRDIINAMFKSADDEEEELD